MFHLKQSESESMDHFYGALSDLIRGKTFEPKKSLLMGGEFIHAFTLTLNQVEVGGGGHLEKTHEYIQYETNVTSSFHEEYHAAGFGKASIQRVWE